MKAVLLAGGKGTRLKPYTTNFPKPLMPIGDKPILEIVINNLKKSGIEDVIIATGHLSELIKAFFKDGKDFGVNIEYSHEDEPMGTAGPLGFLKEKLDETFLIMNGDVLSDLNFLKFYEYHKKNGNVATIGTAKRTVNIDFGVVRVDEENRFSSWDEKPNIDYLVSMGIYLMEPEALDLVPRGKFFNLPDLILALDASDKKVSAYIHKGYWLDIGRPADYEKANDDYEKVF